MGGPRRLSALGRVRTFSFSFSVSTRVAFKIDHDHADPASSLPQFFFPAQGPPKKNGNMLKPDDEQSFFDRERDRLTGEIATVRAFF